MGAFLFTASGWSLRHLQYVNVATIFAHLPWLLAALLACASQDPRRRTHGLLALSLLTMSEVLLGFQQGVWFNGVAEGILVGWLLLSRAIGSLRVLFAIASAKVLGLLGGAIQVLPSLDAAVHSVRASDVEGFWTVGSLPPPNLFQAIHPYLFAGGALGGPREYALYSGVVSAVLVAVLIARARTLDRSSRAVLLLALALIGVAAVLAMGKYAVVYTYLGSLPGLRWLRYPARITCVLSLGVALASALALDQLLDRPIGVRGRQLAGFAALVAASVLLSLAGYAVLMRAEDFAYLAPRIGSPAALVSGPLLVIAACSLVIWASRGTRTALFALALFAAADLAYYGLPEIYAERPKQMAELVSSLDAPPTREGFRVGSHDNGLLLDHWRLTGGYVGLPPATRLDRHRELHLRLAGISWRFGPETLGNPDAGPEARIGWHAVPDPIPRVRVVTTAVDGPVPYPPGSDIEPLRVAWLDEPIDLEGGEPGTVQILEEEDGDIDLLVEGTARQLMAISERWHPDWKVEVDGAQAELLRVDGDFMGVLVDPGAHRVSLRYRSMALRRGAAISAVSSSAVLGLWILGLLRHRRPAAAPQT